MTDLDPQKEGLQERPIVEIDGRYGSCQRLLLESWCLFVVLPFSLEMPVFLFFLKLLTISTSFLVSALP